MVIVAVEPRPLVRLIVLSPGGDVVPLVWNVMVEPKLVLSTRISLAKYVGVFGLARPGTV